MRTRLVVSPRVQTRHYEMQMKSARRTFSQRGNESARPDGRFIRIVFGEITRGDTIDTCSWRLTRTVTRLITRDAFIVNFAVRARARARALD